MDGICSQKMGTGEFRANNMTTNLQTWARVDHISQSENNFLNHEQVFAEQVPSKLTWQASPQQSPQLALVHCSSCIKTLDDVAGVLEMAISPITMTKIAKKLITNAFIFEKFLVEEYLGE